MCIENIHDATLHLILHPKSNMTFPTSLYSRRDYLRSLAGGFGSLAFAALASRDAQASTALNTGIKSASVPKQPHFPASAKRIIMIFMQGGVSHLDTFDHKPQLQTDNGKSSGKNSNAKLFGSPWKFKKHGECGQWVSELLPHVARHVDDLCFLSGMHTDSQAHETAVPFFHTGNQSQLRPAMGAWALYGLGSECDNLPGYIATQDLRAFGQNHGSAFLPAAYQATILNPEASNPVANLKCPHLSTQQQRRQLNLLQQMNQQRLDRDDVNSEVEAVIASYEMAFRMQSTVPDLLNFSTESKETQAMYGLNSSNNKLRDFGRQCLMARRFAEEGVRFIEIGTGGWDHHFSIAESLPTSTSIIDQPIAALLTDLKQRGMLDDTLVVWAGEFGRTPAAQNGNGRDHNNRGFTIWLAGGGVKPGFNHGMTDEYGKEAVEGRVHVHDLHATMLHLLGLDHERLTYRNGGRDYRLTDVYGRVVKEILA